LDGCPAGCGGAGAKSPCRAGSSRPAASAVRPAGPPADRSAGAPEGPGRSGDIPGRSGGRSGRSGGRSDCAVRCRSGSTERSSGSDRCPPGRPVVGGWKPGGVPGRVCRAGDTGAAEATGTARSGAVGTTRAVSCQRGGGLTGVGVGRGLSPPRRSAGRPAAGGSSAGPPATRPVGSSSARPVSAPPGWIDSPAGAGRGVGTTVSAGPETGRPLTAVARPLSVLREPRVAEPPRGVRVNGSTSAYRDGGSAQCGPLTGSSRAAQPAPAWSASGPTPEPSDHRVGDPVQLPMPWSRRSRGSAPPSSGPGAAPRGSPDSSTVRSSVAPAEATVC